MQSGDGTTTTKSCLCSYAHIHTHTVTAHTKKTRPCPCWGEQVEAAEYYHHWLTFQWSKVATSTPQVFLSWRVVLLPGKWWPVRGSLLLRRRRWNEPAEKGLLRTCVNAQQKWKNLRRLPCYIAHHPSTDKHYAARTQLEGQPVMSLLASDATG